MPGAQKGLRKYFSSEGLGQAASCLASRHRVCRPRGFRALFPLRLPGICSTWTSAATLRWPAVSQGAKPTLGSSGSKGRFLSSSMGSLPASSSLGTSRVFTLPSSYSRGMWSSGLLCADWSSGRVESESLASPFPLLPQVLGVRSMLWNQRSPQRRDGGGDRVFRPHPDPLLAPGPQPRGQLPSLHFGLLHLGISSGCWALLCPSPTLRRPPLTSELGE